VHHLARAERTGPATLLGRAHLTTAYQATDLARSHREVIDAARRGAALIRDKDGLPLLLQPAEQAERTEDIAAISLDLLRAARSLLEAPVGEGARGGASASTPEPPGEAVAYGGLAWLSVLPMSSKRRFFVEATEALLLAASGTSLRPLEVLIGDWRATAEAWADPNTRERLLAAEEAPLADAELQLTTSRRSRGDGGVAKQRRSRSAVPGPVAWTLRPASARARREWEVAVAAEPVLLVAVRERLRTRPLDRSDNPNRTDRLRPPLDTKLIGGVALPQWQHELSGAGRIHYCPVQATRTIWVTMVSLSHPRATE
jgi:hypothetical protein